MRTKIALLDTRTMAGLAGLLCLLTLFNSSCTIYRAVFSPELEIDLHGPLTVSSEWTDITPARPMKAERAENAVMFDFASALNERDVITERDVSKWGIRTADGSVVMPEVELVDEKGNVYPLRVSNFGTKGVGFHMVDPETHLENLPRDRTYRTVRIRCSRPISFSRVYWSSYNQSDRK